MTRGRATALFAACLCGAWLALAASQAADECAPPHVNATLAHAFENPIFPRFERFSFGGTMPMLNTENSPWTRTSQSMQSTAQSPLRKRLSRIALLTVVALGCRRLYVQCRPGCEDGVVGAGNICCLKSCESCGGRMYVVRLSRDCRSGPFGPCCSGAG